MLQSYIKDTPRKGPCHLLRETLCRKGIHILSLTKQHKGTIWICLAFAFIHNVFASFGTHLRCTLFGQMRASEYTPHGGLFLSSKRRVLGIKTYHKRAVYVIGSSQTTPSYFIQQPGTHLCGSIQDVSGVATKRSIFYSISKTKSHPMCSLDSIFWVSSRTQRTGEIRTDGYCRW